MTVTSIAPGDGISERAVSTRVQDHYEAMFVLTATGLDDDRLRAAMEKLGPEGRKRLLEAMPQGERAGRPFPVVASRGRVKVFLGTPYLCNGCQRIFYERDLDGVNACPDKCGGTVRRIEASRLGIEVSP